MAANHRTISTARRLLRATADHARLIIRLTIALTRGSHL